MNKNIVLPVLILSVAVFVLTGCNASRGLGQDIENTGDNIQDTVDKND